MTKEEILAENVIRNNTFHNISNPIFGYPWTDSRFYFKIKGIPSAWIPLSMKKSPLIKSLRNYRSIFSYLHSQNIPICRKSIGEIRHQIHLMRLKHDFPYWTYFNASLFFSKSVTPKPFFLNKAQLDLIRHIEMQKVNDQPVRLIAIKPPTSGISSCLKLFFPVDSTCC